MFGKQEKTWPDVCRAGQLGLGELEMAERKEQLTNKSGRVSLDGVRMAERLLRRRKELGWSLRELAERSGVSTSAVHAMEQGNTRAQLDNFIAVLAALDLLPEDVLDIEADAPPRVRPRVQQEVETVSRLADPAEALRRLAAIIEETREDELAKNRVQAEVDNEPQAANDSIKSTAALASDDFYDALARDILLHLVSLAGDSGITPPLSTAKIGEALGDASPKGKRTKRRIGWLIQHDYISDYAKPGGPRGRQYKIEGKTRAFLKDHPA